jgi:glycosyltransferase involved in cell wall biosynthesis
MTRILLFPYVTGRGGVRSFMEKFRLAAESRGVEVVFDENAPGIDAALVLAGVWRLDVLSRLKRRGVRIVHRLDGMNWLHRRRWAGIRYSLRAEYGNLALSLTRGRFADRLIYQSEFVHQWWNARYGTLETPWVVIHNGVDLQRYTPEGKESPPKDFFRILLVEGNLQGAQGVGLGWAVSLLKILQSKNLPVELTVAGGVSARQREKMNLESVDSVSFLGFVPPEDIPALDRSAHLLFSADVHAACPNAVVEALACGTPVLAFDTGALRELVPNTAGRIVPYGGDAWKLEPPDLPALADAAEEILRNQKYFREGARRHAVENLDIETMTEKYLDVLLG